jgi:hypothetical protein
MRRSLIEVVLVLALVALAFGVWWWGGRQREAALAEQRATYETQIADLEVKSEYWASELVQSEAHAAFRAFIAGISPAVMADRADNAELALIALLDLHGVDFAHLLRPNGEVISSSDRKLSSAGTAGERANWALSATEIISRESATRGVTELAAPIPGSDGPIAYVWMGYRTEQVMEELRPESLQPKAPSVAAEPEAPQR